jgi:hypothetical protein
LQNQQHLQISPSTALSSCCPPPQPMT